jgi:palmitoyl transferase
MVLSLIDVAMAIPTCRTAVAITLLSLSTMAIGATGSTVGGWIDNATEHVSDTWHTGDTELYIPFLTHHMRFNYDADLIDQYNEFPAGIGLGKGRYNNHGNWEGLYAMGFLDSHSKPSFMAGYAWVPSWRLTENIKAGVGVTGFLMSRRDYFSGVPFPGILPVASISYKQLAIQATYVPSTGRNNGNVLFMWGKWTFQ